MENKNKRVYFVSDLHLGAPALLNNRERELLFVDWLKGIREDVSELYLLGDVFDFWFEYKKVVPKGFTRLLGTLADFTDQGIPVHFFAGNHDIWIFDYLQKESGMILHHDSYKADLNGKKFFLSHGDDLGKSDFGYQFLKGVFKNRFAQWAFAKIHPDLSFLFANHWSKKSRLAYKEGDLQFKGIEAEEQCQFARNVLSKEYFDFFIFGHRHLAMDIPLDDQSRMIVLGDWIRKFTYGVFDGIHFSLEKIDSETLKKFSINI